MPRMVLAAAALAATAAIGGTGTAARADGMPYCISGDTSGAGNSISSCIYMSYRQCQHTVRDTGRSCVQNPRYMYGSRFEDSYAMVPGPYGASYDTGPTVRYIVPSDY